MPTFRDRHSEIEAIQCLDYMRVLNFYGEHGIGKTCLIREGAATLRKDRNALVFEVDLEPLAQLHESRAHEMLTKLVAGSDDRLPGQWDDPDVGAGQIVDRLSTISRRRRVTLIVDTTEVVQEDVGFWHWFERYMLSPLVFSEGELQVVLAGRLPAPIHLVEVRRYLKVWPLEPLPVKNEARQLVHELLAASPSSSASDELTDVVLAFSHGHPLLSEEIARFLADPANHAPADSLRERVAKKVVGPFIEKELLPFRPEMSRWRPLMEWASVLDWFDATVFYRFDIALSGSQQPEIEWRYDFVKAIAQLRAPYAVVRWEDAGYTLVGTIKSIVASYLQAARRVEYMRALRAAVKVFAQIAEEYFADNPQAGEPYRKAARSYEQRLEWEVQYGPAQ